jgi:hypothetical protein
MSSLTPDKAMQPYSILRLTLKKKWFDMILSGEKKEEYREVKWYWFNRLVFHPFDVIKYVGVRDAKVDEDIARLCSDSFWSKTFGFKPFDYIEFKNGYSKTAPTIIIQCNGIKVGNAKPEWSDKWKGDVFVILLGEILLTENLKNSK